jgi:hypothetical protein
MQFTAGTRALRPIGHDLYLGEAKTSSSRNYLLRDDRNSLLVAKNGCSRKQYAGLRKSNRQNPGKSLESALRLPLNTASTELDFQLQQPQFLAAGFFPNPMDHCPLPFEGLDQVSLDIDLCRNSGCRNP